MQSTIPLKKETIQRLKKHGKFGESWDELVNRILDNLEKEMREG